MYVTAGRSRPLTHPCGNHCPRVFAESDVATTARIVDASNNKELSEWWSSGAWQTNENSQYAQVIWNEQNPRRLVKLYMYQMGNSFHEGRSVRLG